MILKNKIAKKNKCDLQEIKKLSIEKVEDKEKLKLWQYLIKKYHYIKETKLVGAQIKYLIKTAFEENFIF